MAVSDHAGAEGQAHLLQASEQLSNASALTAAPWRPTLDSHLGLASCLLYYHHTLLQLGL